MSTWGQNLISRPYKTSDSFFVHLLQRGSLTSASDPFVAIGHFVEHTAVLRVEEGDRDRCIRLLQSGEEVQAVHFEPGIKL